MDTVVENKTYSFKSGDKCMFCQTPMPQPNVVKIPKHLGNTNKGSCCTKCSDIEGNTDFYHYQKD